MTADLLRRAAKTLREAGEGATPGPWLHVDYAGSEYPDMTFMGCGSVITMGEDVMGGNIAGPTGDCYPRSGYSPLEDMRYIALMHPPVALALAECMEVVARMGDHGGDFLRRVGHPELIAVARAVLREAAPA